MCLKSTSTVFQVFFIFFQYILIQHVASSYFVLQALLSVERIRLMYLMCAANDTLSDYKYKQTYKYYH